MKNTQVALMTSAETTANKISQATKIGKQVMKAQLEVERKKAENVKTEATEKTNEYINHWSKSTEEYLKSKIKLSIRNDGEITRLRNLLNKFFHEKIKSNMLMVRSINTDSSSLFSKHYELKDLIENVNKILSNKYVKVYVTFQVAVPENAENEDNYLDSEYMDFTGFNQEIPLSNEILEALETYVGIYKDYVEKCNNLKNIIDKIKNIDSVVEEMEAQLLVNELSQTDEGKDVLKVTSNLVSQMLGKTPTLLNLQK